jgi:hypothetical protein
MGEVMDCMVNYFGHIGDGEGMPRRYYCYLVVAGPGPTETAGVATISTLAVHEGESPCDYCQSCFYAETGGPEAALVQALLYLNAYHDGHHLRRVISQVRRTPAQDLSEQRRNHDEHPERFQAAPWLPRPGRDGQSHGGPTAHGGV